jgi:formylglycine-generating enzyme required for sulfatase activity
MHVFLSYAKKDTRSLALGLRDQLRTFPYLTVWMDESLEPAASWARQIELEIDRSDYVVVLLSPDVNRPAPHSFVLKEIAYAQQVGKPIIVVLAQATKIPLELAEIEYIDFTRDAEQGFVRLRDYLQAQAGKHLPPVTPPPPAAPPDFAAQLERAIALIDAENALAALPLLEALHAAQYRPRAVKPLLEHARLAAAEQQKRLDAEHAQAQHRAKLQDIYDDIALLARNQRTREAARQEWTQFIGDYPDWRVVLGADPAQLSVKFFTLPLLEWMPIPAGRVTLERGSDGAKYNTEPLGTFEVAAFQIAKYPVTNAQFQAFIADGGYDTDRYWEGLVKSDPEEPSWDEPTCPRESVNWYEAIAFTRWLSEKTQTAITLPTEQQWQWAAAGDTGWAYPYGPTFDATKCNTFESGIKRTTPVDRYPQGASPFGVVDMSGNVWEWCLNEYGSLGIIGINIDKSRSLRGGSWYFISDFARAAFRYDNYPVDRLNDFGFRVVCSALVL